MINIWEYSDAKRVRIVTNTGTYEGLVDDICDVEDKSDLEPQEDSICIVVENGAHIDILQSAIKSIERL